MKKYRHLYFLSVSFILLQFLFGITFMSDAAASDSKVISLIMYDPDLTADDAMAAVSAAKHFANYVADKVNKEVSVKFFSRLNDFDAYIAKNPIQVAFIPVWYLVEKRSELNLEPFVILVSNGKTTRRRAVLVRKDSDHHQLEDLRGEVVSVPPMGPESIPYLSKVTFQGDIEATTFFKKIQITKDANSAVLSLLYNEVQGAIVDMLNFEVMTELNPMVGKKLHAIFVSPEEPQPAMVYVRGSISENLIQQVKQELLIMHTNPAGQQALMTFRFDGWEPCQWADFERIEQLMAKTPLVAKKQSDADLMQPRQIPPEKGIRFTRLTSSPLEEGRKLLISARIESIPTNQNLGSVNLHYSINKEQKAKVPLTRKKQGLYETTILLPEQEKTTGSESYTVQSGDSLVSIARKKLGSSTKWKFILDSNRHLIKDPNLIQVGWKLKLFKGAFSGIDVTFQVAVEDETGTIHKSQEKVVSVIQ
ncbi:PhnD/SsuA/transferrin family substrate-binding protein [candidate division CSSED10-310 bacterium]|uniref:PhnD/SsuA/transferrin family substrate-binding protein n=1 Tax=candidate division CSSED10-310 bacterium TaxID=2855610 RepID=A0ABV6Z0U3_UNCC1